MATVHHYTPGFTGAATIGRRTLTFTDGVAPLVGPSAAWRRAGYRIGPDRADVLDTLTVAELRDRAAAAGVDVPAKAKKSDVIAALEAGSGDDG